AETAVSYRDVGAAHWLGPVLPAVDPGVQTLEIGLQIPLVVLHLHPIDPWTGRASLPPKRPFERGNVDVMQQCREPCLARTSGRLIHTLEVWCRGCQRCVWPFACPDVIPSCRSLFSITSFPSVISSIIWSGPTPIRDAANCGCPSFVAPIGDQPMD